GLGTVLGKDGRILTALSPLGAGNDLEAKFADDTVQKLKLGHHDRLWDLALLVPQGGKWKEGLNASNSDPLREGATIRSFTTAAGKAKPVAKEVELRSRRSLLGGDDKMLSNALEMGSAINSKDIGAPLIDEKGKVVGVLGRACLPIEGKPCAPVAYGVPVSAIKSFLKTVPPDAVQPSPWLGIQGVSESSPVVKGVRVLSVAKGSPAADAKLKGGEKGEGDMIVAVAGKPVTSPEELASVIKSRSIGEKVPLTVFSKGLYRQSDIVLKAPPETSKAAPAAAPPKEEERTFATPPPQKSRKALKAAKPEKPQKAEAPKKKAPPPRDDDDDMFDQAD
ncbi:MAG: serine protease, partial [Myxococcales bacterium]|nr:serine protease [Myxococcales bacterium]